ncbi:MAG: GntR family transcriptional regulator [Puniceicoccales bacterium]
MRPLLPQPVDPKVPNIQGQVVRRIESLARGYGAGMKLPTMVELAKSLGVTVSTVDRSLGRLEEMGIIRRKRGSGIYVSSRIDQKRIGLVFGRNVFAAGSSPFYRLLMERCEKRAQEHNEIFSFYLDTPQLGRGEDVNIHHDLADALTRGRLDGVLVANKRGPEQDRVLRSYGLPTVVLSQNTAGYGLVTFDAEDFLEQAIDALHDQGCHSIGLLGTLPVHRESFEKIASRKNATIDRGWVHCLPGPDEVSPNSYESEGRAMVRYLYEKNRKNFPGALIVKDDMLARGVCSEFGNLGAEIGRDIHLVAQSNKNCDVLYDWEDRLSLIEFDSNEIVEAMFSELEALMKQPDEPRPPVVVKGHLKAKL